MNSKMTGFSTNGAESELDDSSEMDDDEFFEKYISRKKIMYNVGSSSESESELSIVDREDRPQSSLSIISRTTTNDLDYEFVSESNDDSSSSNAIVYELKGEILDLNTKLELLQIENDNLRSEIITLKGETSGKQILNYSPLPHKQIEQESTNDKKVYEVDLMDGSKSKVIVNRVSRTLETTTPFALFGDKYIHFSKTVHPIPVVSECNAFAFLDSGGGQHYGKTTVRDPLSAVRINTSGLIGNNLHRKSKLKRLEKQVSTAGIEDKSSQIKTSILDEGVAKKGKGRQVKHEGCGSLRYRLLLLKHNIIMASVQSVAPCTSFICAEVVNRLLRLYSADKDGMSVMFYNYPRMISECAARMLILLNDLNGHKLSIPLDSPFVLPKAELSTNYFETKDKENHNIVQQLIQAVDNYDKVQFHNKAPKAPKKVVTSEILSNFEETLSVDYPLVDKDGDDEFTKKKKSLARRLRDRRNFLQIGRSLATTEIGIAAGSIQHLENGTIGIKSFEASEKKVEDWLSLTKNYPKNFYAINNKRGTASQRKSNEYCCSSLDCQFISTRLVEFEDHMNTEHDTRMYLCSAPNCHQQFGHKSNYIQHIKNYHS